MDCGLLEEWLPAHWRWWVFTTGRKLTKAWRLAKGSRLVRIKKIRRTIQNRPFADSQQFLFFTWIVMFRLRTNTISTTLLSLSHISSDTTSQWPAQKKAKFRMPPLNTTTKIGVHIARIGTMNLVTHNFRISTITHPRKSHTHTIVLWRMQSFDPPAMCGTGHGAEGRMVLWTL